MRLHYIRRYRVLCITSTEKYIPNGKFSSSFVPDENAHTISNAIVKAEENKQKEKISQFCSIFTNLFSNDFVYFPQPELLFIVCGKLYFK